MKVNQTRHFRVRFDEYFGAWEEFDAVTYSDVVRAFLASEEEFTLEKESEKQRVCTIHGVRFCVGYKLSAKRLSVTCTISPFDTERSFRESREFKLRNVESFESKFPSLQLVPYKK